MQNEKRSKFGELLVQAGMVSQSQLDHALQIQKEQEERQSIGGILVDLGYMTRRKLRSAVKRFGRRVLIGELLLADGAINREQLVAALREHRATGESLGRILIGKGIVDEDQLARVLGKQLNMPYVIPHAGLVDMNVFCRLPGEFIRGNSVLPVSETDGVVTVIVADPVDRGLIERLEKVLGNEIDLATCGKTRIDKVIDELMFRRDLSRERAGARGAEGDASSFVHLSIDTKDFAGAQTVRRDNAFDRVLCDALDKSASDIHFEPQRDRLQVRYRIDGVLCNATDLPLPMMDSFARRAKVLTGLDPTDRRKHQEGRLCARVDGKLVDFRIAVWSSVFGESMAIRCVSTEMGTMKLADLGMTPQALADFTSAIEHSRGATLFVGPTGAGKTTSFYTTLGHLNDGSKKILTVEAPVELTLDGIAQHDLHRDTASATVDALEATMQHDPDVIGLGKVVSDEVAEKLLHVCMTGHKIFATMHAEDVASALLRLSNLRGAASFLISCSILVIAQVLVRKVCSTCAEVCVPSPKLVREFQVKDLDLDAIDFRWGSGCSECMGSGFRGRTGIFEVFEAGPEIQKILLTKPSVSEIRKTMIDSPHFLSLRQAGFLAAAQGVTTLEEVVSSVPPIKEKMFWGQQYTIDELCRKAGLSLEDEGRDLGDDVA